MSGAIRRIAPLLRQIGIAVDFSRVGHRRDRMWSFRREGEFASEPSDRPYPDQTGNHNNGLGPEVARTDGVAGADPTARADTTARATDGRQTDDAGEPTACEASNGAGSRPVDGPDDGADDDPRRSSNMASEEVF